MTHTLDNDLVVVLIAAIPVVCATGVESAVPAIGVSDVKSEPKGVVRLIPYDFISVINVWVERNAISGDDNRYGILAQR